MTLTIKEEKKINAELAVSLHSSAFLLSFGFTISFMILFSISFFKALFPNLYWINYSTNFNAGFNRFAIICRQFHTNKNCCPKNVHTWSATSSVFEIYSVGIFILHSKTYLFFNRNYNNSNAMQDWSETFLFCFLFFLFFLNKKSNAYF